MMRARHLRTRSLTRSGSLEHLVFALATVVVAVHIVDDAFVQPEAGASTIEHLTLLVPVGIAALAVFAYPSLGGGARASTALVFGILGLTGGGIAVAEARGAGLSGHDYTGLLLVPAGIALLVLGTVVLWRSRKTLGSRSRQYGRRALIAIAAVVIGFEVVFPLAFAIVATHRPRSEINAADLGRSYENVTLRTPDGLDLAGWYVPPENGAVVIAFPGRQGPLNEARMLIRHGYGVLMFDMRGQGESEGDPNLFGWDSPKDLAAAIEFLESRPEFEAGGIGGLGLSVGGEQMIQAAAENELLRAVVSEGAGERSIRESWLQSGVGKWLVLPFNAVSTAAVAVMSGDRPPPSLESLIPEISPRPVLLIYATHGQGGENLNPTYYAAAREPKTIWALPEASHAGGLDARPEEYEQRVIEFFDEALLG